MHLFMGTPWTNTLDVVRGRVLLNMCFNMGWLSKDGHHGLGTFTATLALVQGGHYPEAAAHMLASLWARQVGERAVRLASRMATGDYNASWEPGEVLVKAAPSPPPDAPTLPPAAQADAVESPSVVNRILDFLKRNLTR
jgi:hypothetical protein